MHKYVIMGVQGCGKGTQASLLEKAFDLVHISVGDIFRWNIQHHTKLGAQVKRIVASGTWLAMTSSRRSSGIGWTSTTGTTDSSSTDFPAARPRPSSFSRVTTSMR